MQVLIGVSLLVLAMLGGSVCLALRWWKSRRPIHDERLPLFEFHSDQPPPAGTTGFNRAIVEACGSKTTDAFKLKILTAESITIAQALLDSRISIELQMGKVSP